MAHKLGIPAILTLVAMVPFINPSVARADTFLYTAHEDVVISPTFTWSFGFSFTEPTLASSGQVTSSDLFSVTSNSALSIPSEFSWNSAAGGSCTLSVIGSEFYAGRACVAIGFNVPVASGSFEGFPAGSFLTTGSFNADLAGQMNVTITDLSIPEPSSIVLLSNGLLVLFGIARKKRLSRS
ncbi:MAG TPA: PEP-CTERM sorting domain-containing protein [Edaphobacter sp.]